MASFSSRDIALKSARSSVVNLVCGCPSSWGFAVLANVTSLQAVVSSFENCP